MIFLTMSDVFFFCMEVNGTTNSCCIVHVAIAAL